MTSSEIFPLTQIQGTNCLELVFSSPNETTQTEYLTLRLHSPTLLCCVTLDVGYENKFGIKPLRILFIPATSSHFELLHAEIIHLILQHLPLHNMHFNVN